MLLPKRLRAVRFVLVLVMVILPALAVAVAAISATGDIVQPEAERRAELAARTVAGQVEHALDLGIPLPDLVGMDVFLDEVFRETPEVGWLAVTDVRGRVLHVQAAQGVQGAPGVGATLESSQRVLAEPLDMRGETVGRLHLGWRAVAVAGPRDAVLATLLLVLIGAIALAAECGHWLWGMTVGAGVRALEDTLEYVRRGELDVAPRLSSDDALGRAAHGLARLLRLVNFRLDEVRALAEDVASTVPPEHREVVLREGRQPAEGWRLAPEGARSIPPRRQLALLRFALFALTGALFLHVPGLLAAGGWHDKPLVLFALSVGFAAALLMMRAPLPGRPPLRLVMLSGAALAMMVLTDWPLDWAGFPTVSALLLGTGLGLMVLPVRSAARAEGASLAGMSREAAGATVSGALAGLALGGLTESFHLSGMVPFVGAVVVGLSVLAQVVVLVPAPEDGVRAARWPNVQEVAAVLFRWPLLILAVGPGAMLRLLLAVILIGALSQTAAEGLRADPQMLTALGTLLAVLWWGGQALARVIVRRIRQPGLVLWSVMLGIGVVALITPYDDARTALWGIGVLIFLGGAVTPLRHDAAGQLTRVAGVGLGAARVERTIALSEVLALALAPLLVGLTGGVAISGLVQTLALMVLVAGIPAFWVLGPGSRTVHTAQEARP